MEQVTQIFVWQSISRNLNESHFYVTFLCYVFRNGIHCMLSDLYYKRVFTFTSMDFKVTLKYTVLRSGYKFWGNSED